MFEEFHAAVAAFDFEDCSRPQIVDAVDAAGRVRAALDAFDVRAALALSTLGDTGSGPSTMFRNTSKSSQREADKRARRADRLKPLPSTTDALSAGRISAEHADVLGKAAEKTSPAEIEQSGLLTLAEQRPADLFATDVRKWVDATQRSQDREAAEAAAEARQRRLRGQRRLVVFEGDDGMTVIHGECDPVTGAELSKLIDAEANRLYHLDGGRDGADAQRSTEQRRIDALVGLLSAADTDSSVNDESSAVKRPAVRSQLILTATYDPATGAIGEGEIVGTGPIPDSVLEYFACTSELVGLVFSGDGRPLWMGRRYRLATDDQWLGLAARDGGCIGCGLDPSRCEAHHVVAWRPPGNGPTDIENLVLLCAHHHHLVHDHGWQLTWNGGGWSLSPPGEAGQAA